MLAAVLLDQRCPRVHVLERKRNVDPRLGDIFYVLHLVGLLEQLPEPYHLHVDQSPLSRQLHAYPVLWATAGHGGAPKAEVRADAAAAAEGNAAAADQHQRAAR